MTLALPHGIPSLSTFRRVFAAVDPVAMGEVLGRWSAELVKTCEGKQIAIDRKALRRWFQHGWKKMGLQMVTAYCVEDSLVLCQSALQWCRVRLNTEVILLSLLRGEKQNFNGAVFG